MTKMQMPTKKSPKAPQVFQTDLGWMALATCGNTICKLAFGHKTSHAAQAQIDSDILGRGSADAWIAELVERLCDYASGRPVGFDDFEIDTTEMTDFGRRVLLACRKIPYGHTLTYSELATQAGSSGAARAVGNHMAKNPIPLIVPCHRVLPAASGQADKELGGYSAIGGVKMKRRLLQMEAP